LSTVIFLLRRLASALLTLLVVTVLLYGVSTLSSPEERAFLYIPAPRNDEMKISQGLINTAIKQHGFDAPFPIQYGRWIIALFKGDWGWSPTANTYVLPVLLRRSQATAELTLFSILAFIPAGLAFGALAGWRRDRWQDKSFRLAAYLAISLPPFILAVIFLGTFYAHLKMFPPGRISDVMGRVVDSSSFIHITGLLTVDSLLNGRLDVFGDVINHLAMPVLTLSLFHWATLGLVTRATMIEENGKDYIVTAASKGLSGRQIYRRHAFRNVLAPALNSSALSAVSLVTGVFVVESIYDYKGVSYLVRNALLAPAIDVPVVMGFTIYAVLMVLAIMLVLDLLQALADPRYRERLASQ
jgi:ABC-type dipeptide/oligopeptide/nickel transport system permease component